jgi:uncharacterized SAM-binding protein YcdF (DUF218 family)
MADITYRLFKAMLDPVVFFIAVLLVVFWLLARFKYHRRLRVVQVILVCLIVLLYVLGIQPARNALFYPLERDYFGQPLYKPPLLDVVLVLSGGAAKVPGTGEVMLTSETPIRLLHGIQIFRRSQADWLVCSGTGRRAVPADAMAMTARRLGVPLTKIIVDNKARNTAEHAAELNKLFAGKELKIGVVTNAYHLRRSCRQIGRYFKNVYPFPAAFHYDPQIEFTSFMPSSSNLSMSTRAIREHIGNLWYRLRH